MELDFHQCGRKLKIAQAYLKSLVGKINKYRLSFSENL